MRQYSSHRNPVTHFAEGSILLQLPALATSLLQHQTAFFITELDIFSLYIAASVKNII